MEHRTGFLNRSAHILRSSLVEIVGNNRVLIENHHGIIAYGSEEIVVRAEDSDVSIIGKELKLALMTKERLVVHGVIQALKLTEGGRE